MHNTALIDFMTVLRSFNIERDATVMIHSGLLPFGTIEGGVAGLYECIRDALGEDITLVMPTFTLSFGTSRAWHFFRSRSEVGALTEFMRTQNGVIRTVHPFHSVCVTGPHKKEFSHCDNLSSFGIGSPFQVLYDLNAYNLSIGTKFEGGATYLHHTEETRQVPYRYYKDFPGKIVLESGQLDTRTYRFYARIIADRYEYINNWGRVWSVFTSEGHFKLRMLSKAKIYLSSIKQVHDRFESLLLADPFFAADISSPSRKEVRSTSE